MRPKLRWSVATIVAVLAVVATAHAGTRPDASPVAAGIAMAPTDLSGLPEELREALAPLMAAPPAVAARFAAAEAAAQARATTRAPGLGATLRMDLDEDFLAMIADEHGLDHALELMAAMPLMTHRTHQDTIRKTNSNNAMRAFQAGGWALGRPAGRLDTPLSELPQDMLEDLKRRFRANGRSPIEGVRELVAKEDATASEQAGRGRGTTTDESTTNRNR